jgi:glycine/D-amino acid oxidase-like deaminating enzyme
MRRAARLLSRGYRVTATAGLCGYQSASHFSVVFRQQYGVPPVVFKRAAKLDARLRWRDWKDEVEPVRPGSSEYFRRRRRRNEDVRRFQRLIRGMPALAHAALKEHAAPARPVLRVVPAVPAFSWSKALSRRVEREEDSRFRGVFDDDEWDDLLEVG